MMRHIYKRAVRHFLLRCSLTIIAVLILICALGPLLIDESGIAPRLENHLMPPSISGILGYGVNGINVLTWMVYGARLSFVVSILVTIISIFIGTFCGALAGYYGGRIDIMMMRIVDIFMAFPGLLFAFYMAAIMPSSTMSLIFALSATNWASYARLIRARVYEIKGRDFIIAAKALGARPTEIITRHILPNILGPVLVHASYGLSLILLAETGINFLGIGLPLGTPSWGALLAQGIANLFTAPYLAIFPGLIIGISVLAFNFLGDGLRDILDPKTSYLVFRA
jgi:peptide/nickel transport system permease protein